MWCYRRYAGDKTMKTHKEFIEEIKESQKLENRTKDALNVAGENRMKLDDKEYVEIDVGEYINIENDPSNELIEITFWERGKSSSKTRFFKLYDALNVSSEVKA